MGSRYRFGHIPPPNQPPAVSIAAADASGPEGSTLATNGAFTDSDDDPLSLTMSGAGVLTPHSDGTWSWTLPTDDDGAGTVVVTAVDDDGESASDGFSWSSTNVAPTITALDPSAGTVLRNADVTWTATATDPGSADAWTWSFDGGAGTGTGATATWTTGYDACGTLRAGRHGER